MFVKKINGPMEKTLPYGLIVLPKCGDPFPGYGQLCVSMVPTGFVVCCGIPTVEPYHT